MSIEQLKKKNIGQFLQVRQQARELYSEMNKLTEQRHRMQAQEIYSCTKYDETMEELKKLDNDIRTQNVKVVAEMALMNLQNMKLDTVDVQKGGFRFDSKNRNRSLDDLKLYVVQNSIIGR